MLKKLLVLAFAGCVSMSASAAFIQYDLKDATFDDGTALTGWFVQNTTNQAIAFYDIHTSFQTYIPAFDSNVRSAWITTNGGPTSFDVWSENNGYYHGELRLRFGLDALLGSYVVSGFEGSWELPGQPGAPAGSHTIQWGRAELGQIDPGLLAYLESGDTGFQEVVPDPVPGGTVPEPASLALVAAGLGLMGRLRKRANRAAA